MIRVTGDMPAGLNQEGTTKGEHSRVVPLVDLAIEAIEPSAAGAESVADDAAGCPSSRWQRTAIGARLEVEQTSNTDVYYFGSLCGVRVTSKGQVTIPQGVRRRLGIVPGSEVEFEVADDGIRLVRRGESDGAALVAAMRGRAGRASSTDEIMALTRRDD